MTQVNQMELISKKMDNTQLSNIGFTAKTRLEKGLRETYHWYIENIINNNEI